MTDYSTVSTTLATLMERGFTRDFHIDFDKLICVDTGERLDPQEFEITEAYRFEGASNPSDEAVVYAVSSKEGGPKGTLVSAFGTYAEAVSDEMIRKLALHHNDITR